MLQNQAHHRDIAQFPGCFHDVALKAELSALSEEDDYGPHEEGLSGRAGCFRRSLHLSGSVSGSAQGPQKPDMLLPNTFAGKSQVEVKVRCLSLPLFGQHSVVLQVHADA